MKFAQPYSLYNIWIKSQVFVHLNIFFLIELRFSIQFSNYSFLLKYIQKEIASNNTKLIWRVMQLFDDYKFNEIFVYFIKNLRHGFKQCNTKKSIKALDLLFIY